MSTRMETLWGYPATVTLDVNGRRIEVDALECTEHHEGWPTRVLVDMPRVLEAIQEAKAGDRPPRDPGKPEWPCRGCRSPESTLQRTFRYVLRFVYTSPRP